MRKETKKRLKLFDCKKFLQYQESGCHPDFDNAVALTGSYVKQRLCRESVLDASFVQCKIDETSHICIEANTLTNLNILNFGAPSNLSIFGILNSCFTKPGTRYLRERLSKPFNDIQVIRRHQNVVRHLDDCKQVEGTR